MKKDPCNNRGLSSQQISKDDNSKISSNYHTDVRARADLAGRESKMSNYHRSIEQGKMRRLFVNKKFELGKVGCRAQKTASSKKYYLISVTNPDGPFGTTPRKCGKNDQENYFTMLLLVCSNCGLAAAHVSPLVPPASSFLCN